jgi:hypothetical protein
MPTCALMGLALDDRRLAVLLTIEVVLECLPRALGERAARLGSVRHPVGSPSLIAGK